MDVRRRKTGWPLPRASRRDLSTQPWRRTDPISNQAPVLLSGTADADTPHYATVPGFVPDLLAGDDGLPASPDLGCWQEACHQPQTAMILLIRRHGHAWWAIMSGHGWSGGS